MKKIFLSIVLFCLLLIIFIPVLATAKECPPPPNSPPLYLVHCGYDASCPCEISDIFQLLVNVYNFIVIWIATPLAVIAIMIGGILMMISAGNPNLMGTGKKILYAAIIGLVLVFGSYLIIDFVLKAVGFTQDWSTLPR